MIEGCHYPNCFICEFPDCVVENAEMVYAYEQRKEREQERSRKNRKHNPEYQKRYYQEHREYYLKYAKERRKRIAEEKLSAEKET